MRYLISGIVLIVLLGLQSMAQPFVPADPDADTKTRQLLAWLYELQGNHTLTGMHDYMGNGAWEMELVHDSTGRYPAVFGTDLGFSRGRDYPNPLDGVTSRPGMLRRVAKYAREGCIIHMIWHACSPLDTEPCTWDSSIQEDLTDDQWNNVFTQGTPEYQEWKTRMDTAGHYLKAMGDSGASVLWRTWPEMNGGWFWWGGEPERFKRLWKQTFHYLTDTLDVHNLLWLWSPNQQTPWIPEMASYYPGDQYVDVLGLDMYTYAYPQDQYDSLRMIGRGKPFFVSETKFDPSPALLDTQPEWTMISMWVGKTTWGPRNGYWPWSVLNEWFDDPRVITADEVAWDTMSVTGTTGVPCPVRPAEVNVPSNALYTLEGTVVPAYRLNGSLPAGIYLRRTRQGLARILAW